MTHTEAPAARSMLDGLRVLDLSRSVAGAHCTLILADYGADVIRIDNPSGVVLPSDDVPGRQGAQAGADLLQSKKSIALDLSTREGSAALMQLIQGANVLVEDFAPGDMDGLQLSYETLSASRPGLIWASTFTDMDQVAAGTYMAFGIITALRGAEATGRGQIVSIADPGTASPIVFDGAPARPRTPPPPGGSDALDCLSLPAPLPATDEAKRALRNAFGAFPTGVTVVTTRQTDGTPRGFTANSFTSVSLDPPMLLICIAKTAFSHDTFTSADHFTVNILGEDQKDISGLFASRQPDKFEQADWHAGHAGMPVIDGSLASFVCLRERLVDAGDHVILLGRVEDYSTAKGLPLGYHAGAYFSVGAEDPLVDATARAADVRIGAVLRKDQHVLFSSGADGTLTLPCAPDGKLGHEGLLSWLAEQGYQPDPQILYAVYEDTSAGQIGIYYHGTMRGPAANNAEFIPVNAIPFEQISNPVERSMMRRYAGEYQHGSFGIYQGNQDEGTVHHLASPIMHAE
ncbi:flavin reductase [Hoeflea sp.]|uniref:flavin reductase n=1 Tax=Hoeflea sp. TaxID=1940281 RepID=UPI003748F7AA